MDNNKLFDETAKHLNGKAFIDMLRYFKETRIKCKHGG
jgi:hypothetical protein